MIRWRIPAYAMNLIKAAVAYARLQQLANNENGEQYTERLIESRKRLLRAYTNYEEGKRREREQRPWQR